jgi:mono/diheme cytochrome c family protein
MKRWAGIVVLIVGAPVASAVAQPFPAADTLTQQQLRGRNLFNQSCMVCHVKLQGLSR